MKALVNFFRNQVIKDSGAVNWRYVTCVGCAFSAFLLLSALLFASFPNVSVVKCILELEQPGRLQVFYWNGIKDERFSEASSRMTKKLPVGEKITVKLLLPNAPVQAVRLDVGDTPGRAKIYSLLFLSNYNGSQVLGPEEIFNLFQPGTDQVRMQLEGDAVIIDSQTKDPFIISKSPLQKRSFLLTFALPAVLALLFFFFLYQMEWGNIQALVDLGGKRPTSGNNIDSLDGLRGLAAIMVVGDHTYGRLMGMGAGGVWIFMVLSGFLLAQPFITNPRRITSFEAMKHFYQRRLRRVLPAYYAYIIIVYLLSFRFDLALRHFLFLEGAGHLWVIPQEMMFYLLFPLVLLVNYLFLRGNTWLSALFTVMVSIGAYAYLTREVFSMYGVGNIKLPLYAGVFFTGVACAYLQHCFTKVLRENVWWQQGVNQICAALGVAVLLAFLLGSTGRLWGGHVVYAQTHYQWFSTAAGLLVLCIVLSKNTFLQCVLCWKPLRAIGVVSLSLYLFHPLVINFLLKGRMHYFGESFSGISLFLCTLSLSYMLACFSYAYIEKPFSKKWGKEHLITMNAVLPAEEH